jgi:hypothetical protein
MNHNEEVPDLLGGLGDMLPADVLKVLNELLEQLHRKDKDHQGSPVFIYAPGSQYVDKQFIIGASPSTPKPHPLTPSPTAEGERPRDGELHEVLATDEAMILWQKAQQAGYVDGRYQPLISRTQSALLADAMAERLGIKEKWKVFETLWNRKYMRSDYNLALTRKRSLDFQDELKRLFG